MNQQTPLVSFAIAGVKINQDADGRYCLNDLHKAAGGDKFHDGDPRHEPYQFMRNDQTQALVAEISNSANSRNYDPVKTTRGKFGGTYACKELVYAYANWISPAFYLRVIRTFDAVVTGDLPGLPANVRTQIGGIVKGIVHKEFAEAINDAIQTSLPALIHGALAAQQTMMRKGETVGQVWKRWGLPTKGLRGYPTWFGNRLAAKGCQIDGGGRAESGGITSRLFDPDKCDAHKHSLLAECQEYIAFRFGQGRFYFGGKAA